MNVSINFKSQTIKHEALYIYLKDVTIIAVKHLIIL